MDEELHSTITHLNGTLQKINDACLSMAIKLSEQDIRILTLEAEKRKERKKQVHRAVNWVLLSIYPLALLIIGIIFYKLCNP